MGTTFQSIFELANGIAQLLLIPILTLLMFYSSKKRKENAEAKMKELEVETKKMEIVSAYANEWKELYEESEKKVEQKDAKIDQLYAQIERMRQEQRNTTEENGTLKLQLQAAEFRKCDRQGCKDRLPPSDY